MCVAAADWCWADDSEVDWCSKWLFANGATAIVEFFAIASAMGRACRGPRLYDLCRIGVLCVGASQRRTPRKPKS